MIYKDLKKHIEEALRELGIPEGDFVLEHSDNLQNGDYSTNVALVFAKELKAKPRDLAEKIASKLKEKRIPHVEKIEVAGAGFVNFFLSKDFFAESVDEIIKAKKSFGKGFSGKGKCVLVEYSSPNIAKPFTVGHLRSTIIGDAIANILDFSGYKVIRDNHVGDWGTQFGKQIVAFQKWGSQTELEKSRNKMKYLVDLYVKFHAEAEKDPTLEDEAREAFQKLEKGDKTARKLYSELVSISKDYFREIYSRLAIRPFDTEQGESFYEKMIPEVLKDLEKAGIVKESEGARLVFFENEKYPPLMIQKKDGATLYSTRDLATDKWRKKKYGDKIMIVNETGVEQSLYFSQLYEVEEMLGYFKNGERVHVMHGFIRLPEGKMATRKGNVIWLEEVLDEAEVRAGEINKETAKVVAMGAIKFNDLKRESRQDIVFNWDEIINLKGDSGPYLQYSCVRAKSILKKADEEKIDYGSNLEARPPSGWRSVVLEKMLYRFPEVVERAGREYAPNYIATYLIELASSFNTFYAEGQIVSKSDSSSLYKIALTKAFSIVIENGLNLLGIQVPPKM
ncbi:MAG: arginine--tRNA ligase [Candidatus Taylorbacteria bacterium]